jgi:Fe-S-cluster-containing dehydrogenase component
VAEGFIFNHNKCVACGACTAACILENKWPFRARVIYTFNSNILPDLPVTNLSLACNHCKNALCMEGCPSSAYIREPVTGAVIIDDVKCIGCKYCQWNCPYDAPKYLSSQKVIGKCNLCYHRLSEGLSPACATACPTGALRYGTMNNSHVSDIPWFPEKGMDPAIEIQGNNYSAPEIFPQYPFEKVFIQTPEKEGTIGREWSLIAFSFLTILSVSKIMSSLILGEFPGKLNFFSLLFPAAFFSLFHLGKKLRAWRAVRNVRYSPLSREIGLFIIYSLLAGTAVILQLPVMLVISSLAGLLLLLAIDVVYIFADKRKSVFLHSGQSFISALLIVSFLTGKIMPFIFIAVIRLAASVWSLWFHRDENSLYGIRFFRPALLIIAGSSLITGISDHEKALIFLFFTGELLDRILFYIDFKPLNINRLPDIYIIGNKNEKEIS